MLETIVIGGLVLVIIAAGIFSWWMENGEAENNETEKGEAAEKDGAKKGEA